MGVILLAVVVLAALLIIASGFWVAVALVRALSAPPEPKAPAQTPRESSKT